jgi:hypothetical protein
VRLDAFVVLSTVGSDTRLHRTNIIDFRFGPRDAGIDHRDDDRLPVTPADRALSQ